MSVENPQSSGWFAPSPCNILSQPLAIIPQGSPIYEDYEDPMLNKEGFPTVGIGKG
jgi:NADPH-dependent 7-cyano-7-deazaguanine reductase QueF-like protein